MQIGYFSLVETNMENEVKVQEIYRPNRFEATFDTTSPEIEKELRLSCHSIRQIPNNSVEFLFYDLEGNGPYYALKRLIFDNPYNNSQRTVVIKCYNGDHSIYETLKLTGTEYGFEPMINFDWSAHTNTVRDLRLILKDVKIISIRR